MSGQGALDDTLAAMAEADPDGTERLVLALTGLAAGLEPVSPPDGLFAAVMARVRPPASGEGPPGTLSVRADEGRWRTIAPGVEIRLLWHDQVSGKRATLLRMGAGAVLPPHDHLSDEYAYMLEGQLAFGDHLLGPGDFHLAPAGVAHPPGVTPGGCLVFLVAA